MIQHEIDLVRARRMRIAYEKMGGLRGLMCALILKLAIMECVYYHDTADSFAWLEEWMDKNDPMRGKA